MHPRVEPEIGIVLGRDLSGPGLLITEVADAVAEVRACLEIVDSIWWDYRFSAEQNTADGSSAAGVVLGPALDVDPLRCHRVPVELTEDDVQLATAVSAAASGHPLHGVAWLAAELAARGRHLQAGELVITGGLTAATPLRAGRVLSARFGAHHRLGAPAGGRARRRARCADGRPLTPTPDRRPPTADPRAVRSAAQGWPRPRLIASAAVRTAASSRTGCRRWAGPVTESPATARCPSRPT
ncbi:2-keto-4-pentenoate hydratase [Pseudonocardia benzenivorans]